MSEVDDLHDMIGRAVPVTHRTFRRRCAGVDEWAKAHGYERRRRDGCTLAGDWHVGYYRSQFKGRRCYFIKWSAIENIWL